MTHQRAVLVGALALVVGMTVGLVKREGLDEEALKTTIAGFMAVPAEDVTIPRSDSAHGIATAWVQVDGETDPVRFRISEVGGEDVVIQMTNLAHVARSTADVGVDTARKRAVRLAAEQYVRWGADMEETEAKRLPIGSYLFMWKRFTPEAYETGDFVSVTVHGGTGAPASYVASYASRSVPPSIDRQRALSIALDEVRGEAGPHVSATADDARCVLSLPQLDLGPVWIVSVTLTGDAHQHGKTTVIIDGLTGKVVPKSHAQAPAL